jgi:hypothetical protein
MVTVPPSQYTPDPTWVYALELPHDPRAVRIARVTLGAVLAGHGMSQVHDVPELLASELVTNAYRHSTGPAALRLTGLGGGRLRMSVWDTNPHIPPPFDKRDQPLCPVSAGSNPMSRQTADGGCSSYVGTRTCGAVSRSVETSCGRAQSCCGARSGPGTTPGVWV